MSVVSDKYERRFDLASPGLLDLVPVSHLADVSDRVWCVGRAQKEGNL